MQMHVAEGIQSLLFPFRWPHAVVSVLPVDTAIHFFDAPVPYIIGVVVPANMKIALRREIKVCCVCAKGKMYRMCGDMFEFSLNVLIYV